MSTIGGCEEVERYRIASCFPSQSISPHTHPSPYSLLLKREELDNPHKRKTWKYFKPGFAVEVLFAAFAPHNVDATLI